MTACRRGPATALLEHCRWCVASGHNDHLRHSRAIFDVKPLGARGRIQSRGIALESGGVGGSNGCGVALAEEVVVVVLAIVVVVVVVATIGYERSDT